MSLIDCADAGGYVVDFTITTTVNRSSYILTGVGLLFSRLLTVYSAIGLSVGELIKPHDVEGQGSTLAEDIYFNQTPLSLSLNASEIRQMEYCKNYRHLTKKFRKKTENFYLMYFHGRTFGN